MTLYKNKYRIESTRLKGWDYVSPGSYFTTICTKNREYLFGEIRDGNMVHSPYGSIVDDCWQDLPNHYDNIRLGASVIMPNHFHGIVNIVDMNCENTGLVKAESIVGRSVETGFKPVATDRPVMTDMQRNKKRHGLFEFVRALKTFSARRINQIRNTPGVPIWQPRFHDHIIRNQTEYFHVSRYIKNNPTKWETDKLNSGNDNCIREPTQQYNEDAWMM